MTVGLAMIGNILFELPSRFTWPSMK